MSPFLLAQETRSPPLLLTRGTSDIKDSIRQAVPEAVQRASNKLSTTSQEVIEQSTKPSVKKAERALVCQSSPEKRCGTINSLLFWYFGSTSQHLYSNHPLWAPKAFQVYKGCSKKSMSRCSGFHKPDFCYMWRGRWQPLPPCLEAVFMHHLQPKRYTS